ncbi:hypothetical protein [Flaviaesturariibacter amylovorans]|uniref:Uncharacterized protein n=1 Tax=Flaviaesturariibacter amylovorans TaxID=1084520 RepID=A0ABP8H5F1_9BACT
MKQHTNARISVKFRVLFYILQSLILLTSLNALAAGYSMIVDPSGKSLGFQPGMLAHSPFGNYLVPGILLAFFVGVLPMALFVLLAFPRLSACPRLLWWGTLCFGAGLGLWIFVQVLLIGFVFFLQAVIAAVAVSVILICLVPPFQHRYQPGR